MSKLAELDISLEARGRELDIYDPGQRLTEELISLIRKHKAELLSLLEGVTMGKGDAAIPQAPVAPYYALSFAQQRLYFLYEFDRKSLAYNLPKVLMLEGAVDRGRLETTFQKLVARHESLRTCFEVIDEKPVQCVWPQVDLLIEYLQAAPEEVESTLRDFIRPFDLGRPSLMRVGLLEITPQQHLLVVDMHHIIADGVSMGILIRDFMALYKGEGLGELPIQYKDYAAWQQGADQRQEAGKGRAYWLEQFADEVTPLDLPTDHARPSVIQYEGSSLHFVLEEASTLQLKRMAEKEDATLFMVLLSAYVVFLSKISNQHDIVVGTLAAGRQYADLQEVMGMFVNTLAIRSFPDSRLSFREFLATVKERTLACIDHQDYPYEALIDELKITRDASRNPLFDVVFDFINYDQSEVTIPGIVIKPYTAGHEVSKFDLTLSVMPVNGHIACDIEYSTTLFKRETIERFIGYFKQAIADIVKNPGIRIGDINILPQAELEQLLVAFNDTALAYADDETIVSLFEKQAALTPDKTAIVFEDEVFSYRELDKRASQLAHYLRTRYDIKPGDLAGIMTDRSAWMVIGLLGILKSGAAYIPIDPAYPLDRTAYILRDSGASILLVGDKLPEGIDFNGAIIQPAAITNSPVTPVTRINKPTDLCYLIYTSGSTGNPKGVMITHGNVVNFFAGMNQRLPLQASDCMLAITSTSFDISVLEIFWTLCYGAEVVIHPSDVSLSGLDRYTTVDSRPMDFSLLFFSSYTEQEGEKYKLLLDSAQYADQAGFKAVWTPERHFHEFGGLYPNPAVTSAALAMVTRQIELRCGSVVSPLHDPLRIAEEWSVVDNLSRGRVALSFAAGWNPNDFAIRNASYTDRQTTMYQQIETVKQLWRGESINRVNGLGKEVALRIFPAPVQKELPVWVTSGGSEETFISAGAIGANLLTHLLGQSLEDLAHKINLYRLARKQHGHEGPGKVAIMLHTYVGEDINEVEQLVEEPFIAYLKSAVGLSKILAEESGINEEEIPEEKKKWILKNAFRRYYKTGSLIGTRSSCGEMIGRLAAAGIDEIACLVDFGISREEVMKGLKHLNGLKKLHTGQHKRHQRPITLLQSTPSFIKLAMENAGTQNLLQSLRLLMLGGEPVPAGLVSTLQQQSNGSICNMYGPTETTIWSCIHEFEPAVAKVLVGKPIANTQIYILNKGLQAVPVGVAGDLYIGGHGVARGYWNRPELTRERFIKNPYNDRELIYQTGDVARWLANGTIELLGREDHQVKIRGYRIELGEIENRLCRLEPIREAVVVAVEKEGNKYLVAYYVAETGIEAALLRKHLLEKLPEYMVPSYFVHLEKMPLTPNGKINRKGLPDPELITGDDYEGPANEVEEKLVALWADVLKTGRDKISVASDFFKLGGHSLNAMILVNRIEKKFDRNIPLKMFYHISTVREIAQYINAFTADAARQPEQEEVFTF